MRGIPFDDEIVHEDEESRPTRPQKEGLESEPSRGIK